MTATSLASLSAQNTQWIKGTVMDEHAGFSLPGVNVLLVDQGIPVGTVTDIDGQFRLEAPVGRVSLQFTFVGYEPVLLSSLELFSAKELVLDVKMEEDISELAEVVVSAKADKDRPINEMATVSARGFTIDEATRYSGGRNDVARLSQSFAGVSNVSDNRNDIVVRGNAPTGLLWRLDGVDIPNPNHFGTVGTTGGPVSILNINNLKDSDFLTSAFPAEYGNALSGVFDLQLRNGNADKYEFTGAMGFNGLEFGLEGPVPIGKNASLALNYRYSTLAIASQAGLNFGTGSAVPKYQDLTFKLNVPTEKLGRFSLWGMGGKSEIDFIATDDEEGNLFNNDSYDSYFTSQMGALGLNHLYFLNQNTTIKTSVSVSTSGNGGIRDTIYRESDERVYHYRIDNNQTFYQYSTLLNRKLNAKNTIRAGVQYRLMSFSLVDSTRALPNWDVHVNIADQTALASAHASWLHRFDSDFRMTAGVYAQRLSLNGSLSIEPRMNFSLKLAENQDLNFGVGLHSQMQPLVTYYSLSASETGYEMPNQDLDFTKSFQVVLGYDWRLAKNWRFKSEVYQQWISGAPVDRDRATSWSLLNSGTDFVLPFRAPLANEGLGFNYGAELTLEKFLSHGFYSLVTLSLFNSTYKGSDGIDRSTAFNGNYVTNFLAGKEWKINPKNSISLDGKLNVSGGRRYTPIDFEASKELGYEVLLEDQAFSGQLDAYFRTDLKLGWIRNGKNSTQQLSVDVQNITNQKNVFLQEYDASSEEIETIYQIGLFPVVEYKIMF